MNDEGALAEARCHGGAQTGGLVGGGDAVDVGGEGIGIALGADHVDAGGDAGAQLARGRQQDGQLRVHLAHPPQRQQPRLQHVVGHALLDMAGGVAVVVGVDQPGQQRVVGAAQRAGAGMPCGELRVVADLGDRAVAYQHRAVLEHRRIGGGEQPARPQQQGSLHRASPSVSSAWRGVSPAASSRSVA